MTTLCVTVFSCVASIFGMNLKSGLEDDRPSLFVIVVVLGLASSVCIMLAMTSYMRRKRLL